MIRDEDKKEFYLGLGFILFFIVTTVTFYFIGELFY